MSEWYVVVDFGRCDRNTHHHGMAAIVHMSSMSVANPVPPIRETTPVLRHIRTAHTYEGSPTSGSGMTQFYPSQTTAHGVIVKGLQLQHAARTVGQRGKLVAMSDIHGKTLNLLMAGRYYTTIFHAFMFHELFVFFLDFVQPACLCYFSGLLHVSILNVCGRLCLLLHALQQK